MKNPQQTARRWLAQAEHSLSSTGVLLDNGLWSDACFYAEQTAELALKAFLYGLGQRFIDVHSVRQLAQDCSDSDGTFSPLISHGTVLDRYYLATSYPAVFPAPAIPFQSFTEQDGKQALVFATEIVDVVRAKVQAQLSGQ